MHLRNPYSGEVSTLEAVAVESYERLDRDDISASEWTRFDPDDKEQFLYANDESYDLRTLSVCVEQFDIDRAAKGYRSSLDNKAEYHYLEVVKTEDGYWVGADGAQLEPPVNWQRELIDPSTTSRELESLLSEAVTPDNSWNIQEPLNRALYEHALMGNVECCKVLMDAGANVEAPEAIYQGFTPLHSAASRGYVELAQLLLDAGANPNAVEDRYGGMTPLHFAASNDETEVGLLLLSRGGNPEARTRDGETCIEQARSLENEVLGEAFKAHIAEKRAAKLEAAWGSTQPTKDNLQAAQPTQAAPALAAGRRPRF